jgi:hypothetical protein
MIYAVLIFIFVIGADLFTDVDRYFGKRKVNHTRGAILRCIGLAPVVYFLCWQSIPMLFFLYLILFNGFYNLLIGQKWEFLGTTSKLDRMQAKIQKWVKYVLLILSIYFYVKSIT